MSDTSVIHMSSSVKSYSRAMQSAVVLFTPGMYWMLRFYSNSRVDHLLILWLVWSLANPFVVRIVVRGLWSVRTVNLLLHMNERRRCVAQFTASVSFSITEQFFLASDSVRDTNIIRCSTQFDTCESTALKPYWLASVVSIISTFNDRAFRNFRRIDTSGGGMNFDAPFH